MRKPLLLAAALAALAAPAAQAQNGNAPTAAAQIDPERLAQIQRAALILRTFNIAFQSNEVQQPVKGQLLSCLYNNKLSDIAAAANRVFAANPNLKQDDAAVVYRVAAGVCGVQFRRVDAPPPAGAPAPGSGPRPAPTAGSGEGR